jgi:hypothetical protein
MVATVSVAQERLRTVGGPLDRAVDLLRGPGADGFFGVAVDLGAEAAADIGRHDAQLVLGHAEDEGAQDQPQHMRILRRGVAGEAVGRAVVLADRRARLHRIRHEPVVVQVELRDVGGVLERGLGRRLVAELPVVAEVARRRLAMELRCAGLESGDRIDHRRQDVVIDLHELCGVARLAERIGDHHRDMVADVAHGVDREHGVRRRLVRLAVLALDHPAADQAADLVARRVLAGEHGDHAGCGLGRGGVDLPDLGVGVRRAHEHGIGLAGAVDVVDIHALAGDETEILAPADRCSDLCRHDVTLPWVFCPFPVLVISRRASRRRRPGSI